MKNKVFIIYINCNTYFFLSFLRIILSSLFVECEILININQLRCQKIQCVANKNWK